MTTKPAPIDQFLSARWAEEKQQAGEDLTDQRSLHSRRQRVERTLRDIDSKTRILVRCQEALMMVGSPPLTHFVKQTLLDLARPYEQHPEYRGEDWKWEMR